jgi:hypothetical protein
VHRAARALRVRLVRAHDLHRGDRRARTEREGVRVPRAVGDGHAVGARAAG